MMQTHKGECFCNKCLTADNVGQCCSGSSDALFHVRAGGRAIERASERPLAAGHFCCGCQFEWSIR